MWCGHNQYMHLLQIVAGISTVHRRVFVYVLFEALDQWVSLWVWDAAIFLDIGCYKSILYCTLHLHTNKWSVAQSSPSPLARCHSWLTYALFFSSSAALLTESTFGELALRFAWVAWCSCWKAPFILQRYVTHTYLFHLLLFMLPLYEFYSQSICCIVSEHVFTEFTHTDHLVSSPCTKSGMQYDPYSTQAYHSQSYDYMLFTPPKALYCMFCSGLIIHQCHHQLKPLSQTQYI